jgi:hypothetical protein
MAKIRPRDVAPIPVGDPKVIAWAIVTNDTWDTIMETPNQLRLWELAGFDLREFNERRVSLDGTKALFRIDIYRQVVKDRLDTWVTGGFIEAYYPYNHQEFDGNGNPTDTTILEFLSGNPDWESGEEI